MSGTPRYSIRNLVRVWILGIAMSALALSAIALVINANDEISQQMELAKDLTQLYSDDSVSIELGRGNLVYVDDSLKRLNRLLKGDKARILSNDGTIVESTEPSEIGTRPGASHTGQKVISVDVREHSSLEKLGTLEVLINRNALLVTALKKAALPAILLFLVLSALSLLIIRSLQKRLIRPIEQVLSPTPVPATESANWPVEIDDLSSRLKEAIERRDLAVVGQMAGGIIHDLKTLLHSAWTAAQLAEEQPVGSEKRLQRLEFLLKATGINFPKMNALIQTTLDGATPIRVSPQPGSIVSTIEQAIKSTEHLASRSQVSVQLEASEALAQADHDPTQLERALTNLIKNAIEAAGQNKAARGKVLVRASSHPDEGSHVIIEDSGQGLGNAPSRVLRSVQSTKIHGSGLGLVISRKIIEAHSGRLLASSSESLGGARFDVIIPNSSEELA